MRTLRAAVVVFCSASISATQATHTITAYTTAAVGFHSGPRITTAILVHLAAMTQVEVAACDSVWCATTYNGAKGYLPKLSLFTQRISATGVQEPGDGVGSLTVPPELVRAIVTTKTDLRKLVTAEEVFFADSLQYTTVLRELPLSEESWSSDFNASVELLPGSDGWRATATNTAAPGWTCGIYVGY